MTASAGGRHPVSNSLEATLGKVCGVDARLGCGGDIEIGAGRSIGFHLKNPLEGYRRLTFMMLDADIVAVSPASVWRVLGQAGLLRKWNGKRSKKGTGFEQPPAPRQRWHIDVSYINIAGTFYYLCTVLDGFSRFIVHWDLRPAMTEGGVEIILQAAREQPPRARRQRQLRRQQAA